MGMATRRALLAAKIMRQRHYNHAINLEADHITQNWWYCDRVSQTVRSESLQADITAQSPSSTLKGGVSYQLLFNWKVNLILFHPFSYLGYTLISKKQWGGKFQPHGRKCVLLEYTYGQQAYKLLDLECRTISSSHHVTFDEYDEQEVHICSTFLCYTNVWTGQISARTIPSQSR